VILTPDATKSPISRALERLTGYPVRSVYKQPDEPDVHPLADCLPRRAAHVQLSEQVGRRALRHLALGLVNEGPGWASDRRRPLDQYRARRAPGDPGNLNRLTKAGVMFVL